MSWNKIKASEWEKKINRLCLLSADANPNHIRIFGFSHRNLFFLFSIHYLPPSIFSVTLVHFLFPISLSLCVLVWCLFSFVVLYCVTPRSQYHILSINLILLHLAYCVLLLLLYACWFLRVTHVHSARILPRLSSICLGLKHYRCCCCCCCRRHCRRSSELIFFAFTFSGRHCCCCCCWNLRCLCCCYFQTAKR